MKKSHKESGDMQEGVDDDGMKEEAFGTLLVVHVINSSALPSLRMFILDLP